MARPEKRPSKSLEWHAQNNGAGPKMGHQSWLSAYNDGYSNADVIRWVDGDPENRKSPDLYNQAKQLQSILNQNTLQGTTDLMYLQTLGRPSDPEGRAGKMENFEKSFMGQGRSNNNLSASTKKDRAYEAMREDLVKSPEGSNTQQVAKNAYQTFLGRAWEPGDKQGALNQTANEIMNSTEAVQFRNSLNSYGQKYGGGITLNYDSSQARGYVGNGYQLGLVKKWKEVGRNSNQIIPSQQIVILDPQTKKLKYTESATKLLSTQARRTYDGIINDFNRSPGGNYTAVMGKINSLDSVGKSHFISTDRASVDSYYKTQVIKKPWDPSSQAIAPPTGGFDAAYYLNNNTNLTTQWNTAKNNKIAGYSIPDLDITGRYTNLDLYANADYSQRVRSEPTLRANAVTDIDPYSEAYNDLPDAIKAQYRDDLLGLTKQGASGDRSIDWTDKKGSVFENVVIESFEKRELLEQDKFGTLTQDSLKFAADELKKQQQANQILDLYKNLPGVNEVFSVNEQLSNSILGDSGIGGYLSMLGKDTEEIEESLERQLSGATGIPSSNSAVFNWEKWYEEELVKRYEDMEEITVQFDDTISDLDLNSELGKIQYEIQLKRMGIEPYDENENLISKENALQQLEENNFQRIYEFDEDFKTNFIDNYLKPRFDTSKSMDEFISYMDVQDGEDNIFQTQSALDSLKTLASSQAKLKLDQIKSESGDFNYEFYFNPTKEEYGENSAKEAAYDRQARLVQEDWDNAKANGNLTPRGQVADANGNNYTWNQWAYFYGADLNDADSFAKLHYQVIGAAEGFDPADDILTKEDVDSYLFDTVLPALDEAKLDLGDATFMDFVTPEQFADEVLRGVDPLENKEEWKKILEMYGLDESAAIDEVRGYIFEAVRTGAAKDIREGIKYLNEKRKKPTQEKLGISYIQREEDDKDIEDEEASELYKIFRNSGYGGTEDEFFDEFMPDADRSDIAFLQRGLSGNFNLADIGSGDPFETLSNVDNLFGDSGGNLFGDDEDTNKEEKEKESSYFSLFDDEDDEDYASETGRSIIDGYSDFFK
jgi:hypothetical protein